MYYLSYCPRNAAVPSVDADELENLAYQLQLQQQQRKGIDATTTAPNNKKTRRRSSVGSTTTTLHVPKPPPSNRYLTDGTTSQEQRQLQSSARLHSMHRFRPSSSSPTKSPSSSSHNKKKSGGGSLMQNSIRGGRSSATHHVIEEDGTTRPASASVWMRRTLHSGSAAVSSGALPKGNFSSAPGSINSNGFTCGLCYGKFGVAIVDTSNGGKGDNSHHDHDHGGGKSKSSASSTGDGTSANTTSSGRNRHHSSSTGGLNSADGEDDMATHKSLDHAATPAALVSVRACIAIRRRFQKMTKQNEGPSALSPRNQRVRSPSSLRGLLSENEGDDDLSSDDDNDSRRQSTAFGDSLGGNNRRGSAPGNSNNNRVAKPPTLSLNGLPLYSGRINKSRKEDYRSAVAAAQNGYETVAICRFCSQFFGVFLGRKYDDKSAEKKEVERAKRQFERRKLQEQLDTNKVSRHRQQQQLGKASGGGGDTLDLDAEMVLLQQQHQNNNNDFGDRFVPGYVDEDVEREKRDEEERLRRIQFNQRIQNAKITGKLFHSRYFVHDSKYDNIAKRIDDHLNRKEILAKMQQHHQQQAATGKDHQQHETNNNNDDGSRRPSILSGNLGSTIREEDEDEEFRGIFKDHGILRDEKTGEILSEDEQRRRKQQQQQQLECGSLVSSPVRRNDDDETNHNNIVSPTAGTMKMMNMLSPSPSMTRNNIENSSSAARNKKREQIGSHTRERATAYLESLRRRAEDMGLARAESSFKQKQIDRRNKMKKNKNQVNDRQQGQEHHDKFGSSADSSENDDPSREEEFVIDDNKDNINKNKIKQRRSASPRGKEDETTARTHDFCGDDDQEDDVEDDLSPLRNRNENDNNKKSSSSSASQSVKSASFNKRSNSQSGTNNAQQQSMLNILPDDSISPTHTFASVGFFCATNLGSCVAPTCVTSLLPKVLDASVVECTRIHRFDMNSNSSSQGGNNKNSNNSYSSPLDDVLRSWKTKCSDPFYLQQQQQEAEQKQQNNNQENSNSNKHKTRGMHLVWLLASCRLTSNENCCDRMKQNLVGKLIEKTVVRKKKENEDAAKNTKRPVSSSSRQKREEKDLHQKFVFDQRAIVEKITQSRNFDFEADTNNNNLGANKTSNNNIDKKISRRNITVDGLPSDFCLSCFLMKITAEAATRNCDVTFILDLGAGVPSSVVDLWKETVFSFTNVAAVICANYSFYQKQQQQQQQQQQQHQQRNSFSSSSAASSMVSSAQPSKPLLGSVTSALLLSTFYTDEESVKTRKKYFIRRSPLQTIQELFLAHNNNNDENDKEEDLLKNKKKSSSNNNSSSNDMISLIKPSSFWGQLKSSSSAKSKSPKNFETKKIQFAQFYPGAQFLSRPGRALVLPHTLIGSGLKFVPVLDAAGHYYNNGTSEKIVGVSILLQSDVQYQNITLQHANNIQRALLLTQKLELLTEDEIHHQQQQQQSSTEKEEVAPVWIVRICACVDGRVFAFLMVNPNKIQQQQNIHRQYHSSSKRQNQQQHKKISFELPQQSSSSFSSTRANASPTTTVYQKSYNDDDENDEQESITSIITRTTLTAAHVLKRRHHDKRLSALAGFCVDDVQVVTQVRKEFLLEKSAFESNVCEQQQQQDDEEKLELLVGKMLSQACKYGSGENDSENVSLSCVDYLPG